MARQKPVTAIRNLLRKKSVKVPNKQNKAYNRADTAKSLKSHGRSTLRLCFLLGKFKHHASIYAMNSIGTEGHRCNA